MEANEIFDEHELRFEHLIWIPSAAGNFSPPKVLLEFGEDLPESPEHSIYQALPRLRQFLETNKYPDEEDLCEALWQAKGFVAKVARPVFDYDSEGKMASFSWGHYWTDWIYGETLEALAENAARWAEEKDAADRAKGTAKAAAHA